MSRRTKRVSLPVSESLHYGDIVCYIGAKHGYHDAPIMYVSPCRHRLSAGGAVEGLIDLVGVDDFPSSRHIEHKDATMWQRCPHV